jgi:hypothetical protein
MSALHQGEINMKSLGITISNAASDSLLPSALFMWQHYRV